MSYQSDPGPVVHGKPLHDPVNLGRGWVGFDFQKAFGRPTKVINDACRRLAVIAVDACFSSVWAPVWDQR
jgi:hypothetical protein